MNDGLFQDRLREAMIGWQNIKSFGLDILVWWENKRGGRANLSICERKNSLYLGARATDL